MRPPIAWYGGKQRMARHLLALLPETTTYVEPFCGGATLLFAKKPSVTDVINDLNTELVTFYRVMQTPGLKEQLIERLKATPYARACYNEARAIYRDPVGHDEVSRAWAIALMANWSFGKRLDNGGWGICYSANKSDPHLAMTEQRRLVHLEAQAEKLKGVYIECDDALSVIKRWDHPNALFYCDPPYPSTNQAQYNGYSQQDFESLLGLLSNIKGSFLLSCYPNEAVPKDWERHEFNTVMSASGGKNLKDETRKRTEVVWRKLNSQHQQPLQQRLLMAY